MKITMYSHLFSVTQRSITPSIRVLKLILKFYCDTHNSMDWQALLINLHSNTTLKLLIINDVSASLDFLVCFKDLIEMILIIIHSSNDYGERQGPKKDMNSFHWNYAKARKANRTQDDITWEHLNCTIWLFKGDSFRVSLKFLDERKYEQCEPYWLTYYNSYKAL